MDGIVSGGYLDGYCVIGMSGYCLLDGIFGWDIFLRRCLGGILS